MNGRNPTRAVRIDRQRAWAGRVVRSAATIGLALMTAGNGLAVTHDSPEVLALVEKGLQYLETRTDDRLGAKCLVALAFKKAGRPSNHPLIEAGVSACNSSRGEMERDNAIYSKALAVIFLSELDAVAHRSLIEDYARLMSAHRKQHGGFGYTTEPRGDTSQTQYAALAYWELLQTGQRPSANVVEECANWLIRTQTPEGAWGYLARDPGDYQRRDQTNVRPSMLSAGLSSVLICGDMLGILKPGEASESQQQDDLPPELRPVESRQQKRTPNLNGSGAVDRERMLKAWVDGRKWMDENFTIDNGGYYTYYHLYALERYKSFEEHLEGGAAPDPDWYNRGYEYLKDQQQEDGSWKAGSGDAGEVCPTAFAILFLLRSTKGSLGNLGEGTLVGGRGLPRDLSKAKLKNGKLVVESKPTAIDELLGLIDEGGGDSLDALLDNPAALQVENVGPDEARRLQQIVRSGDPGARLLAVRALSRLRSFDYVPTLIFAMTDPDPRVVRQARDGLRFVSRRFEGFGLADEFEDRDRDIVKDKWKQWYAMVRPDAPPLP